MAVVASYMAVAVLVEKEYPISVVAFLHVAGCEVLTPITRHPRWTSMAGTPTKGHGLLLRSLRCIGGGAMAVLASRW